MSTIEELDLSSPEFTAHPHPTYARLRRDAPVHRMALPDGFTVWLVTRYSAVVAVLRDERFVKNYRNALPPERIAQVQDSQNPFEVLSQHMLDRDPPDHTRLRGLVSKAFTPRMIESLRPRIQTIADTLLDAVQNRGQMDLINDYAFPLPIIVIAEMLGLPIEDRDMFRHWSDTLIGGNPQQGGQAEAAVEFVQYVRALLQERRVNPGTDLISGLLEAEEHGDRLSEDELISMVFLLLVAGHETTVNLIGNGTLALLQHPDQLDRLRRDPSLLKPAIEELLRYDGPVETSTIRFAREDLQFDGQPIARGNAVMVVLTSANRDDVQFARPDDLDITRPSNRHLAFGHGIHYCLGAPLARIEGQIALGTLLQRLPHLRLAVAPDELQWRAGLLLRGLRSFPVAF